MGVLKESTIEATDIDSPKTMDTSPSKPKVWPYLIILLVFFHVLSFATQMIANRQWLLTYVCKIEGAAPDTTNNTLIWEECTKNKIVHVRYFVVICMD